MPADVDQAAFSGASLEYWRRHLPEFIERCLVDPETGHPFVLLPAEKLFLAHAFALDADGRLQYPDLIYSTPKKGGKTVFGAIITITMILLFGTRYAEGFCVANDLEQATSRVFEMCRRIIEASPALRHEAKVLATSIVFSATGARILPLARDYASAAGAHPTISVFDEIWGYVTERGRRLWDELVPVPTRQISARLIVSHAGFEGQSELLFELYRKGLQQPEIAPSLYAGDGMLMFWTHEPVAPWQDEKWLAQMRRSMRPSQYLRMAENRFVTSESSFIDMAKWDACVGDGGHTVNNPMLPVFVGIDASFKHDSTAIVAVTFERKTQQVRLVTHRIFQPSPNEPLNFEATIEATVLDLAKRFQLRKVLFDPFQMQATAQRLLAAGIKVEEFPQSSPNLTASSQCLYDLVLGGNLRLYPDATMRLALSRCVAIETPRGWRIAKEKVSHKIDIIIALAMAAYAAVQGASTSGYDRTWSGWQDDAGGKEGVDRNTEAFKDQLLGFCNGMINGGGGGGRWR